jgi:hypothetical protein
MMTDTQLIHKANVKNKLKRFYKRERKAIWFKVTPEFVNDIRSLTMFINHKKSRLDKHPTWCRNISVQIGLDRDDFVKNLQTVRIDYTYPKYGNL